MKYVLETFTNTDVQRVMIFFKKGALTKICNGFEAHCRGDLVKLSVGIRAATVTDAFNIDFINKQSKPSILMLFCISITAPKHNLQTTGRSIPVAFADKHPRSY